MSLIKSTKLDEANKYELEVKVEKENRLKILTSRDSEKEKLLSI